MKGIDAWTVVSVNPDGDAADRRTNDHGVDLNRNFSVNWSDSEPSGSGYYPGPHPFSEPESKAVRTLVKRINPDLTIYYHQPWGAVLGPCSRNAPQKLYSRISKIPLDCDRGKDLPGTAIQWQSARGGVAFVVELAAGNLSARELRRNTRAAATVAAG